MKRKHESLTVRRQNDLWVVIADSKWMLAQFVELHWALNFIREEAPDMLGQESPQQETPQP